MKRMKVDRRVLLASLGGAVAGTLLAGKARAGELDPPPGGVTPTEVPLKKLNEAIKAVKEKVAKDDAGLAEARMPVQGLTGSATALYVITASGSYYLTGNIQGVPGMNGIEIHADNVDLHLGGFHMVSLTDPGGVGLGKGILCDGSNVTVYDGSVVGWDRGVDFGLASHFILEDVTVIGASSGAFYLGNRGQAWDCDAYSSPVGFSAMGQRTLIEECGAWTCPVGFSVGGTQNLVLSNCATECGTPFDVSPGNAHGPMVDASSGGDISAYPGGGHPDSNLAY